MFCNFADKRREIIKIWFNISYILLELSLQELIYVVHGVG